MWPSIRTAACRLIVYRERIAERIHTIPNLNSPADIDDVVETSILGYQDDDSQYVQAEEPAAYADRHSGRRRRALKALDYQR